jgi:hypothetical protein
MRRNAGTKSNRGFEVTGSSARRTVLTCLALFAGFCVANSFFWWSSPAWLSFFDAPPRGLVNPVLDKWVIMPAAMCVSFVQYPIFAALSQTSVWASAHTWPNILITSFLSAVLYSPLIMWLTRWARRRAA